MIVLQTIVWIVLVLIALYMLNTILMSIYVAWFMHLLEKSGHTEAYDAIQAAINEEDE